MSRVRLGVQNWASPVESCDHLDILADLFSPAWGQEGMLVYGLLNIFSIIVPIFTIHIHLSEYLKTNFKVNWCTTNIFARLPSASGVIQIASILTDAETQKQMLAWILFFIVDIEICFEETSTAVLECLRGFSWQFLIYWALEKAFKTELCDALCTLKILNTCSNEVY